MSQARRYAEALIDRRVVGRDAAEAALELAERTGEDLPDVLLRDSELSPSDLAAGWAAALDVTHVDFEIDVAQAEATAYIDEDVARSCRAVPVRVADGVVLVAFAAPLDVQAVQTISLHLRNAGMQLEVGVSDPSSIAQSLTAAFDSGGAAPDAGAEPRANGSRSVPSHDLYRLFDRALEMGASDLHLAAGQPPFVRVVGDLIRMPSEPELSAARVKELIYSILTQRQQQSFEETWELDTAHAMGEKVRFRVNVFVQRDAVGAAFRVIPYDVVEFSQLGVPDIIKTWADLPRGLVLVTGPTGSGKSTTLASLIDIINRTRHCHVMTIEDPVEFVHRPKVALVNQREVGADTKGFGKALTQAMRQDPDVILVGEMRDLETIGTAITAAETGHLVFGTLHTQDAAQTVDRIIDVFPAEQQGQVRIQLANSLVGVSTQQLVPTADGRSRAVATEVMIANTAIRALIRDGKVHQIHNAMASGKRLGMQSMDESLAELVRKGTVNVDDAMRRSSHPEDVARMLGLQAK